MNAVTEAEVMAAAAGPTGLRQPPASTEAEQSVLGALLLDNLAWDSVADVLRAEDFFGLEHRAIFGVISALLNANRAADIVTVHDRIRASAERGAEGVTLAYLDALQQCVPSARNARAHAQLVRRKALQRALIAATDEAASVAWKSDMDPADQLHEIAKRLDALEHGQLSQAPTHIEGLIVKRIDALNDAASGNGPPPGWSTGLDALDEALNGGMQPGRVYVIAARPSVGKTALALQIGAHRAKAGDGVLVLSQEMPAEECTDRLLANEGSIDYARLSRSALNDRDWGGVTEASQALASLSLWIDDEGALTIRQIRAKAMSLRRQNLKVLIVDYLQLCSGPGVRGMNRNAELEEISRGIKALAKQLGIAVLLLSQLSRDVEKRQSPEPQLSDLRDSGAIEQDADVVAFLWPVRELGLKKIVGLSLAKNRQGRQHVREKAIPLEFLGWHQRWIDSEADISPQSMKSKTGEFE